MLEKKSSHALEVSGLAGECWGCQWDSLWMFGGLRGSCRLLDMRWVPVRAGRWEIEASITVLAGS